MKVGKLMKNHQTWESKIEIGYCSFDRFDHLSIYEGETFILRGERSLV
jgi:hypothetical protein